MYHLLQNPITIWHIIYSFSQPLLTPKSTLQNALTMTSDDTL